MSSQKLTKANRLYLRELQSHLTMLQHEKGKLLTDLQNCQFDIKHARMSQKLINQRLRIIDLRIGDSQKSLKVLEAENKS